MAFGENWGDAYIEVHADTNPLRREMRVAAKRAAQQFGNDFGTEADTAIGKQMSQLGRRIEQDLGRRGKSAGTSFADDLEKGVLSRLRGFDQKIVDSIITGDWSKVVGEFDSLDEAIDKVNARWRQMAQDADLSKEAITDIHLSFRQWEKSVRQSDAWSKMVTEAQAMNVAFDKNRVAQEKNQAALAKSREEWDALGRLIERATREMETDFAKRAAAHERDRVSTRSWAQSVISDWKGIGDQVELASTQFGRHFRAVDKDQKSANTWWGRLVKQLRDYESGYTGLGRLAGSRNDGLHLLGVVAGGVERAVGKVIDRMLELPDAFQRFADRVNTNGGGVQGFFSTLGQSIQSGVQALSSGDWVSQLVKLAVAISAVGTGATVTVAILGLLVTALSGVLGIATALVSVLAYGVAGALLALGPLALAAATGVGVLVTALVGMDDATKDAFKGLGDFFGEIKKQVQSQLFANLGEQIDQVKSLLNGFVGPLLVSGAVALRNVIDYMLTGFQDPAVQETLNSLAYILPVILEDLGRALGDFLIGFLGFFEAISPQVAVLADSIASAAADFAEWANSAEGQTAIKDFFDTASTAASSLWDLILVVGDALGTLFSQGVTDGQSMLDKIVEIIAKFAEWAASDEGREQIKEWFRRAGELASSLWDLVQRVGGAIDALDNQENMDSLNKIIEAVGKVADAITVMSDVASSVGGILASAFDGVVSLLSTIESTARSAAKAIGNLIGKTAGMGSLGPLGPAIFGLGKSAVGGVFGAGRGWAGGNVAMNPQVRLIGEAGAEAVVPLNRSLAMVDPSVRELSAFAQGKLSPQGGRYGAYFAPGAVQVSTPLANPVMVANQVVDRIAQSVTS